MFAVCETTVMDALEEIVKGQQTDAVLVVLGVRRAALEQALRERQPAPGLVHHSWYAPLAARG